MHTYGLRSRYDRLRARGLLTKEELAKRLGVHSHTLTRWAQYGIVQAHAYNRHRWLYEDPGPNPPVKQCSRWNRLVDRARAARKYRKTQSAQIKSKEV
jgi:predicted site-specific integrase-resolvase